MEILKVLKGMLKKALAVTPYIGMLSGTVFGTLFFLFFVVENLFGREDFPYLKWSVIFYGLAALSMLAILKSEPSKRGGK